MLWFLKQQRNSPIGLSLPHYYPITQEIKAFPFKAKKKPNPGVCENPKFTHLSSVKIFPVVTSFPWGT
jgi:hypothetical protein